MIMAMGEVMSKKITLITPVKEMTFDSLAVLQSIMKCIASENDVSITVKSGNTTVFLPKKLLENSLVIISDE